MSNKIFKQDEIEIFVAKNKLKNMISYLCKISGVSRSGYYNAFSSKSQKAFNFKRRKKGARQSKMTLQGQLGILYKSYFSDPS
jgi:hypothetical protein